MGLQVVCAVKDTAIDAFMRPFFVPAPGAAVRSFRDEVNRSAADNEMFKHASDYHLYELGSFDDATGAFVSGPPRLLIRGSDAQDVKTDAVA